MRLLGSERGSAIESAIRAEVKAMKQRGEI